ncbi:hypothetical protein Mgra_00001646, partial [Meloidogyne graminicola]
MNKNYFLLNFNLILHFLFFINSTTFLLFYLINSVFTEENNNNSTLLITQALELAKGGQKRVERIEQMMNSSFQQNEQFLLKGNEALNKLVNEEEEKNILV